MLLLCALWVVSFFFFQAEDGIRDLTVTGVQTCALRSLCSGGPEVGLAHRHDLEIGRQDEVAAGRALEQQAEIGLLHGALHVAGVERASAACSRRWPNRSSPVFRTTSRASGMSGDPSIC